MCSYFIKLWLCAAVSGAFFVWNKLQMESDFMLITKCLAT